MKNKKILYAASTMKHINSFHLEYIDALRSAGHSVMIMAKGDGADFDIPFEKKLFSLKNLVCVRKIQRILGRESFDALILNTTLASFCIRLACKAHSRPKVVNIVHGYLFSRNVSRLRSWYLLLCEKLVSRKTDVIITMNKEDFNAAREKRLARDQVYLTRGMGAKIRARVSNPENLRAEFAPSGSFVLSFVGELSQRKNQEFLIRALPNMCEELPEVVLWLIGDGAERQRLGDLSRELGVADRIVFLGERCDACDFIRASDLYVAAGSIEGMPHNLIEALGAGKTVLASRVKGHADLIDDGVDGFLYEYGNMKEFVNKTCQIYDREIEIDEDKAKNKYALYSKENVFEKTLSTIKEAVEL